MRLLVLCMLVCWACVVVGQPFRLFDTTFGPSVWERNRAQADAAYRQTLGDMDKTYDQEPNVPGESVFGRLVSRLNQIRTMTSQVEDQLSVASAPLKCNN